MTYYSRMKKTNKLKDKDEKHDEHPHKPSILTKSIEEIIKPKTWHYEPDTSKEDFDILQDNYSTHLPELLKRRKETEVVYNPAQGILFHKPSYLD
jgi:hypothetical protein